MSYPVFNSPTYPASQYAAAQPRSYPLFRLHRLVRLKDRDSIREVAVWGNKTHQFMALYCSNGTHTLGVQRKGSDGDRGLSCTRMRLDRSCRSIAARNRHAGDSLRGQRARRTHSTDPLVRGPLSSNALLPENMCAHRIVHVCCVRACRGA